MTLTWEFLRDLCAEAGVSDEFAFFEVSLKGRFVTALLRATGTEQRYLQDAIFRDQVNTIVTIVFAELTQQAPQQTVDMDELTKIFKKEAGEWGK